MSMETMADAMRRLSSAGYTEQFEPSEAGIKAVNAGIILAVEDLNVDEVVRFEGMSDPEEQAILFALECPGKAIRGTFAASYGPSAPPPDAKLVEQLSRQLAASRR